MSAKIVHLKESHSGTIVCGYEVCPSGQRALSEDEISIARFKHQYTVSHVSIGGGGHLQLSPKRTIAKIGEHRLKFSKWLKMIGLEIYESSSLT